MDDIWGGLTPPHPIGQQYSGPVRKDEFGQEPPEVAAMRELGWHLMECETPAFASLTAVWPADQRTWLPDRRVWTWEVTHSDGHVEFQEATDEEIADIQETVDSALEAIGIPPCPRGRLWFVRLPAQWTDVDDYMEHLYSRADVIGLDETTDPEWPPFIGQQITSDFAASDS